MKHLKITFKPDNKTILLHKGETILEAAQRAGIILNTSCGGKGTCGKCVVKVSKCRRPVLACRYKIEKSLLVTVPPESRLYEHKILVDGVGAKRRKKPDIYKKYLKFAPDGKIFGLAVDIGTTTVVAGLIDMITGDRVAVESDLNPQARYGDDVISRINYARCEKRVASLNKLILDCLHKLTGNLCLKAGISRQQIYEVCVVGNTTMNHIFLKLPVDSLGRAPYKAYSVEARDLPPADLKLAINPQGNIHTVENIAGFVGGDTTAGALAVGIANSGKRQLLVDIGTNGEIVLGNRRELLAASCAAGPAFEGARIRFGSRAVEGAIEAVSVESGDIEVEVIGGGGPRTICGSGLIDIAATLCELGVIDTSGRIAPNAKVPARLRRRVIKVSGQPAFVVAGKGKKKIFLTQSDIRQVQLAKSAVRAGIILLQKRLRWADEDIERVFLAGAFGSFLRKESALRIGLLPKLPPEKIIFVSNAAVSGAQMILVSSYWRRQAAAAAGKIKYIELAREKDFQDTFADSMRF